MGLEGRGRGQGWRGRVDETGERRRTGTDVTGKLRLTRARADPMGEEELGCGVAKRRVTTLSNVGSGSSAQRG
jgi:hypothetical protein